LGLSKDGIRNRFRLSRDIVRIRFFGGWDKVKIKLELSKD
jgi:hypothetical protein